jgi:hypothetical protein
MGRIDVRIVEARNLPNTELVGNPDPFVRVSLENQEHKTSAASSTLNPKWDEVFKFVIADPNSAQLELKLWDKNMVSDTFMGQYKMSLSGLTKGVVKEVWCLLQQCKSNAEIHIHLLAHDFGAEPAPGQVQQQAVPAPAPVPVVIQQQPVIYQQPIQQQPVIYQQPIQQQPVIYQQPIQQQPVIYQQPIQQQPVIYQQPIQQQPVVYQQPIQQPTTGGQSALVGQLGGLVGGLISALAADMPSVTFRDFETVTFRRNMKIVRATYGPESSNNDYTAQVNALIQRGQLQVRGGIHTVLGDPAPGVPKVFKIWYASKHGNGAIHIPHSHPQYNQYKENREYSSSSSSSESESEDEEEEEEEEEEESDE